jgi:hypothetical protein
LDNDFILTVNHRFGGSSPSSGVGVRCTSTGNREESERSAERG